MPNHRPMTLKWAWVLQLLVSVVLLMSFAGCASMPEAEPKLVRKYLPPVEPGENETLVYVIRQSAFAGSALPIWIACNQEYKAQLMSGSYCYFKISKGINTVSLEHPAHPNLYYPIDNYSGETFFLFYEYADGKLYRIPEDQGITMVMKYNLAEAYTSGKPNPGYDTGLINPALAAMDLMKKSDAVYGPDAQHATITFIRSQTYLDRIAFGIWSREAFLGNLKTRAYLQIKVPPGSHSFYAKSAHWSILHAEVLAGKRYYVQVAASMGLPQAHLRLLPLKSDIEESRIQQWLESCEGVVLDETAIDEAAKMRLDATLPIITDASAMVRDGKLEVRVLEAGDGR